MADLAALPRKFDDRLAGFVTTKLDRIVLVANNPSIGGALVEKLDLQPDDLLVQFNRAPHFELFKTVTCHKTHIFNEGNGAWWGFSSDPAPSHDYPAQAATSLVFLFKHHGRHGTPLPADAVAYLTTNADRATGGALRTADIPDTTYPSGKAHSIGYLAVCYFRYVNVLRFLLCKPAAKLHLAGFTGKYPPGGAWNGHDFAFEQKAYAHWIDIIKLDAGGVPPL